MLATILYIKDVLLRCVVANEVQSVKWSIMEDIIVKPVDSSLQMQIVSWQVV